MAMGTNGGHLKATQTNYKHQITLGQSRTPRRTKNELKGEIPEMKDGFSLKPYYIISTVCLALLTITSGKHYSHLYE